MRLAQLALYSSLFLTQYNPQVCSTYRPKAQFVSHSTPSSLTKAVMYILPYGYFQIHPLWHAVESYFFYFRKWHKSKFESAELNAVNVFLQFFKKRLKKFSAWSHSFKVPAKIMDKLMLHLQLFRIEIYNCIYKIFLMKASLVNPEMRN